MYNKARGDWPTLALYARPLYLLMLVADPYSHLPAADALQCVPWPASSSTASGEGSERVLA